MNNETKTLEQIAEEVAQKFLDIPTLKTQNSDRLDFHENAVWCIKSALLEMYRLGQQNPTPKKRLTTKKIKTT